MKANLAARRSVEFPPTSLNTTLQCSSMGYDAKSMDLVTKVVARGGIKCRHAVAGWNASEYFDQMTKPGTRGTLWEEHAPRLAVAAARQALAQWPGGSAGDITHVVVHSCTGFAAPGIDLALITELGLPSSTRKLGVNFMGCFGFFTATYVAKQIVEADRTGRAVVLVACAETCSVHVGANATPELIVGNSLFADGAAAAIVTHAGFRGRGARVLGPAPAEGVIDASTRTPTFRLSGQSDGEDGGRPYEWAIGDMSSEIVADSAGAMTWNQTEEGGRYSMYLDKSIPEALTRVFGGKGLSMLSRVGVTNPWSRTAWAIHPGGKSILSGFEKVLSALGVPLAGLSSSHDVLANYGNMSSPTIAFVLQRVLTGPAGRGARSVFMAGFGPGLTVEFGRLYKYRGAGVAVETEFARGAAEEAAAAAVIATAAASVAAAAAAVAPTTSSHSPRPSPAAASAGVGSEGGEDSDPGPAEPLAVTSSSSAGAVAPSATPAPVPAPAPVAIAAAAAPVDVSEQRSPPASAAGNARRRRAE
jgi:predicted naringenin-chalcone synthase